VRLRWDEIITRLSYRFNFLAIRGHIRPVDPLNLFFIIWGVTEYYANFASEISVFFDGKPMPEAAFDKAVEAVVAIVVNGCRPIGA